MLHGLFVKQYMDADIYLLDVGAAAAAA
eukprot:SAG11_NODE_14833_length_598_cov_0.825651_1_plen_27_part_10